MNQNLNKIDFRSNIGQSLYQFCLNSEEYAVQLDEILDKTRNDYQTLLVDNIKITRKKREQKYSHILSTS